MVLVVLQFTTLKCNRVMIMHHTAPNPSPEASHSTTKGCEKSGNARTRQKLIITFISSKVFYAKSVQVNTPFLVRSVRGAANWKNPLTYHR